MEKEKAFLYAEAGCKMQLNKNAKKILLLIMILAMTVCGAPNAHAAADCPKSLVPVGEAVGINVKSEGVIVVEITSVETPDGIKAPAGDAGIRPGDIIVKIGNRQISCGEDLSAAMENCGGTLTVQVMRQGRLKQFTVNPCVSVTGQYSIGVWARDSLSGIGTITFYDPETKIFGALGHEIDDIDTRILFPLRTGNIMKTTVNEVVKGTASAPGQLQGSMEMGSAGGEITINSRAGIFGCLKAEPENADYGAIPTARESEIHTGKAAILSTVDNAGVCEYEIEITRIYSGDPNETRNMMITITDPVLLEKTGGIVQGMSGSPIIQDGKLVGAVTHVLIKDSTKGYGIFIDRMLSQAGYQIREAA